jgi:serine/threonine protein kinase
MLGTNLTYFYAAELVDGIESLHAAGIVHRNLKPEHILIEENGHIVICGFGKSKVFQRSAAPSQQQSELRHADMANSLCGTAEYFAPEVIKGLPYSYGVDWWALGTILYEMLSGTVSTSLRRFSIRELIEFSVDLEYRDHSTRTTCLTCITGSFRTNCSSQNIAL